jgi:hypothetical protein
MKSLDFQMRCLKCEVDAGVGTEGFSDTIYRAFVAVIDTFGQLLMTFKTNITKFYESLKRSEIKAYSESNMLKVSTVEKKGFHDVMNVEVDIPSGLNGSVMEGVNAVQGVYDALKLKEAVEIVRHQLDGMYRAMTRGEDYSVQFNAMIQHFYQTKEHVTQALDVANKVFVKESTEKVPFSQAYASMEEFRLVRRKLMDMEKYPQAVSNYVNDMESMDKILKNVVSFVSSNKDKLDDAVVKSLAGFVRILADYYEIYGMNVSRQMALEHNHIVVIDTLYDIKEA